MTLRPILSDSLPLSVFEVFFEYSIFSLKGALRGWWRTPAPAKHLDRIEPNFDQLIAVVVILPEVRCIGNVWGTPEIIPSEEI